jgi:hypothetical protein
MPDSSDIFYFGFLLLLLLVVVVVVVVVLFCFFRLEYSINGSRMCQET